MQHQTDWTDVTFHSDWADYGSSYATCQYRKIGDRVEIKGFAQKVSGSLSGGTSYTVCQIDSSLAPAASEWSPMAAAGNYSAYGYVSSSGFLFVTVPSSWTSSNWVSIEMSYSLSA